MVCGDLWCVCGCWEAASEAGDCRTGQGRGAFGRDDKGYVGWAKNKQRQQQRQKPIRGSLHCGAKGAPSVEMTRQRGAEKATATATARSGFPAGMEEGRQEQQQQQRQILCGTEEGSTMGRPVGWPIVLVGIAVAVTGRSARGWRWAGCWGWQWWCRCRWQ